MGGGKGGGGGYSGPTEAELASRRAEERAENARQRREARLNALEDSRRQAERDEAAAAKGEYEEAAALAAREAKEGMIGMESSGQAAAGDIQQLDIVGTGERYGTEVRPGDIIENRPQKPKKPVTGGNMKRPPGTGSGGGRGPSGAGGR